MLHLEFEKIVVSVSGKRLEVSSDVQTINKISHHLPADVAALLASMQTAEALPVIPPASLNANLSMSATNSGIELRNLIESINIENNNQSLVRAVPAVVQRANEQQKALEEIRNTTAKNLTIYESGIAFGIIINSSTKEEVVTLMKEYSKDSFSAGSDDSIFFYSDICVSIYFNDDNIVIELQFGEYYKGSTSKGLKIGDSIERAIELYGVPRMRSPKGAVWTSFGIFCQYNSISTIRLQK